MRTFLLSVVATETMAIAIAAAGVGGEQPVAPAVEGKPVAVNPYIGTQQREEVYEFTQKPAVKKEGAVWVVTFSSKANCDATASVLDKDGKVIRHLASGVLGKNAPHPFQQNSLSQKLEWDGTDDMVNAVPPAVLKGCKVRVSLGLNAKFERNIGWEPCSPFPSWSPPEDKKLLGDQYMTARGKDGELYVLGCCNITTGGTYQGRVYKDGKYVRSFWPPSAKDIERFQQVGYKLVDTLWGDKVPVSPGRYGIATLPLPKLKFQKKPTIEELSKDIFDLVGVTGQERGTWPAELPAGPETVLSKYFFCKHHMLSADRVRDEIYIGSPRHAIPFNLRRIDGRTGELDKTWYPEKGIDKVTECAFGPDGNIYLGLGSMGYNEFIIRLDHEGKLIPFTGNGVMPIPKKGKWEGGYGELEGKTTERICPEVFMKADVSALWTGGIGHGFVHERGIHVSPRGDIVAGIAWPFGGERGLKYGIPKEAVFMPKAGYVPGIPAAVASFVAVWDRDGNILTLNAVGDTMNGHNVAMDRDRNVYAVWASRAPEYCKDWVGLPGVALNDDWGTFGCFVKFRGGVPFPRARAILSGDVPAAAVKVKPVIGTLTAVEPRENSLLWAYPGLVGNTSNSCSCHHTRQDMDFYARSWLPANYLYSIVVLDANANIVARLGRYGNVDDTEEDVKAGRDGLRFVWPRAVAVNDQWLYVTDHNARRILKASIEYAAEETVPVP